MMNKLKGLIATVMLMSSSTFSRSVQFNQVHSLDSQSARTLTDAAVTACQKNTAQYRCGGGGSGRKYVNGKQA